MSEPFVWGEMLSRDADPVDDDGVWVWYDYRDWSDTQYPGIWISRQATITTNHPQSSYGIPVLVLRESNLGPSQALGTGDIPAGARIRVRMDDMDRDLVRRAIAAGYPITDSPTVPA